MGKSCFTAFVIITVTYVFLKSWHTICNINSQMTTATKHKESKMSYKVYHTKSWALNTLLHFNVESFNPHMADYKIVADVHVDSIGQVFELTNHIDHNWQENVEVTAYNKKARSTSVGDVVEDPDGQLWICAAVGWEKVEWNNTDKEADAWWIENGERYATYAAEFAMA